MTQREIKLNKLEAYFRYLMWILNWRLERKRVGDKWETRRYWKEGISHHLNRPWWCPLWFKHLVVTLRGVEYGCRSDFTGKDSGLLHGGKGWSEQAFEKLIENIDARELKKMKNRN